jgi:hypothetical protein
MDKATGLVGLGIEVEGPGETTGDLEPDEVEVFIGSRLG